MLVLMPKHENRKYNNCEDLFSTIYWAKVKKSLGF